MSSHIRLSIRVTLFTPQIRITRIYHMWDLLYHTVISCLSFVPHIYLNIGTKHWYQNIMVPNIHNRHSYQTFLYHTPVSCTRTTHPYYTFIPHIRAVTFSYHTFMLYFRTTHSYYIFVPHTSITYSYHAFVSHIKMTSTYYIISRVDNMEYRKNTPNTSTCIVQKATL